MKAPNKSTIIALLDDTQQNLAIELASKLEPAADTLKRYNMTKKDFKVLAATPKFQAQMDQAKIAWASPMNAKERVVAKSSLMTEAGLLRIHNIIHNIDTTPSNAIDAHKHIANLANMMPKAGKDSGESGSKHSITINIGKYSNEPKTIAVEGQVIEHGE